jgi:hypothetical protein
MHRFLVAVFPTRPRATRSSATRLPGCGVLLNVMHIFRFGLLRREAGTGPLQRLHKRRHEPSRTKPASQIYIQAVGASVALSLQRRDVDLFASDKSANKSANRDKREAIWGYQVGVNGRVI